METDPTIQQAIALSVKEFYYFIITANYDFWSTLGILGTGIATVWAVWVALNKEKIIARKYGPKLSIELALINENNSLYDSATYHYGYNIVVQNNENCHTAKNARVFIESLRKDVDKKKVKTSDQYFTYAPDELTWVSNIGLAGKDVYAGMSFHVNFFEITSKIGFEDNCLAFGFDWINYRQIPNYFDEIGYYYVKVAVLADNCNPSRHNVLIHVSDWSNVTAEIVE